MGLAHPPSDQLRVLRSEVDDNDLGRRRLHSAHAYALGLLQSLPFGL
jgi:hypothetical protein